MGTKLNVNEQAVSEVCSKHLVLRYPALSNLPNQWMQVMVRYIPAFSLMLLSAIKFSVIFKQLFLPCFFDGTDLALRVLDASTV